MFLIMSFTAIFSQNFIKSAAMAKVVNTATNLGGLATFIIGGHVWWTLDITLAIANIAGAQLGARTVLGGGTKRSEERRVGKRWRTRPARERRENNARKRRAEGW